MLVAIGFGVGVFGTLIGAGGGFILTPILLLLYPHDSAQTLTAVSLASQPDATDGNAARVHDRRIAESRLGVEARARPAVHSVFPSDQAPHLPR
jgi:uncharacterized membrane protein YfcA